MVTLQYFKLLPRTQILKFIAFYKYAPHQRSFTTLQLLLKIAAKSKLAFVWIDWVASARLLRLLKVRRDSWFQIVSLLGFFGGRYWWSLRFNIMMVWASFNNFALGKGFAIGILICKQINFPRLEQDEVLLGFLDQFIDIISCDRVVTCTIAVPGLR